MLNMLGKACNAASIELLTSEFRKAGTSITSESSAEQVMVSKPSGNDFGR